ncbi:hypothetical protein GYH30_043173 [Glycine max]|uniref:SAWADEE domain-containing protein n=1 Tax=Glycine max TaxID=3847 RepID=K7MD55_SOYBN|nr:hypothetical protein GYH30_043173 [Glycine max]
MLAESDHYRVEFRACKDDAWYTARVSLEGETLTVKYLNLPDEYDNAFRASEFGERFRPLSKQNVVNKMASWPIDFMDGLSCDTI